MSTVASAQTCMPLSAARQWAMPSARYASRVHESRDRGRLHEHSEVDKLGTGVT